MVARISCMAEVGPEGRPCSRDAQEIVQGRAYCWQHARESKQDWAYWEKEKRTMKEMRLLAPKYPVSLRRRVLGSFSVFDRWLGPSCGYCGRRARTRQIVVNPITLQRSYVSLCRRRKCSKKLREWENTSRSRRTRAEWDLEQEQVAFQEEPRLINGLRPQYPSVSRSTLREFLESDYESATLKNADDLSVVALNGSIRTLGFADVVFAEIRDGTATLRRVPKRSR